MRKRLLLVVVAALPAFGGAAAFATTQPAQPAKPNLPAGPPAFVERYSETDGDCVQTNGKGGKLSNLKGDVLADVPASIGGVPVFGM